MKSDREKIKQILRKEMKKIFTYRNFIDKSGTPFAFSFGQAKFDTLMDIDRELKLGAFYKLNQPKR